MSIIFRALPVKCVDLLHDLALLRPRAAFRFLSRADPDALEEIGRRKARLIFKRAWKRTPAYRQFLEEAGVAPGRIGSFTEFLNSVPETTKENYILRFPLSARCVNGVLPRCGSLDDSAGTTAAPTQWVRTRSEFRSHHPLTKTSMVYLYNMNRAESWVVINAFILGAWAGGQRFSGAMSPFGIVKNVGADAPKIVETIIALGRGHRYLIGGYPPFLKELVDFGTKLPGFDWKGYHVDVLTAGEGFVEEWRDYLAERLGSGARIFSNYGAIDTDAATSIETPLTVAIKRLARRDPALRKALFSDDRLPCFLGQYSPLQFLINETRREGGRREFDVTVLDFRLASPKVRYNVRDEGSVIPFSRMREIFCERGADLADIAQHPDGLAPVRYPFLFVFGRSDGTVFFNGAMISPSDIYEFILADPELSAKVHTFKVAIARDAAGTSKLTIDLELREEPPAAPALEDRAREVILGRLLKTNECYRLAYRRDPESAVPRLRVFPPRSGPFASDKDAPKFRYLNKD